MSRRQLAQCAIIIFLILGFVSFSLLLIYLFFFHCNSPFFWYVYAKYAIKTQIKKSILVTFFLQTFTWYKRQTISNPCCCCWICGCIEIVFIERLNNRSLISNYALWCSSKSHHSLRFGEEKISTCTIYRSHDLWSLWPVKKKFIIYLSILQRAAVKSADIFFAAFFSINFVINEKKINTFNRFLFSRFLRKGKKRVFFSLETKKRSINISECISWKWVGLLNCALCFAEIVSL